MSVRTSLFDKGLAGEWRGRGVSDRASPYDEGCGEGGE